MLLILLSIQLSMLAVLFAILRVGLRARPAFSPHAADAVGTSFYALNPTRTGAGTPESGIDGILVAGEMKPAIRPGRGALLNASAAPFNFKTTPQLRRHLMRQIIRRIGR